LFPFTAPPPSVPRARDGPRRPTDRRRGPYDRPGTPSPPQRDAVLGLLGCDRESSAAWTRLARLYLTNYAFEFAAIDTPLEHALTYAENGVRLDPTSRKARCILAAVLLVKGELAAARDGAEKALRFTPDSLVYLEVIGWLLTLAGVRLD
jgi:hypothetical protein